MEDRFKNREEAGQELALFIEQQGRTFDLIYAVPRGGVEVAAPIAARLGLPLQVVFIRKLPYPFSPEMGFGSVDEKG
ncbi:MAG: phosphoribosyltransferase family protein, partial [bacterium]